MRVKREYQRVYKGHPNAAPSKALKTGIPNSRKMEMLDRKKVRVSLEQNLLMFYGFKIDFNQVQLFH
jgi:hypothetical protein